MVLEVGKIDPLQNFILLPHLAILPTQIMRSRSVSLALPLPTVSWDNYRVRSLLNKQSLKTLRSLIANRFRQNHSKRSLLLSYSNPQETLEALSLFESLQVAKLNEFWKR